MLPLARQASVGEGLPSGREGHPGILSWHPSALGALTYLHMLLSVASHGLLFRQPHTAILQRGEDCGGDLESRSQVRYTPGDPTLNIPTLGPREQQAQARSPHVLAGRLRQEVGGTLPGSGATPTKLNVTRVQVHTHRGVHAHRHALAGA